MPNVSYGTYIKCNIKLVTHTNKFSRLTIKLVLCYRKLQDVGRKSRESFVSNQLHACWPECRLKPSALQGLNDHTIYTEKYQLYTYLVVLLAQTYAK